MKNLLLLAFGVLCTSTSVLFIKASYLPSITLAGVRLFLAALALLPLYLKDLRGRDRGTGARCFKTSLLPGLVLGLHFITWIAGARLTMAANATLIVNMVPVVMPFLTLLFFREKISKGEIFGTAISLCGVFILAGSGLSLSNSTLSGDLTCFISMLFFSLYLILARKKNLSGTLWLYVVPLYFTGGVFCLITGSLFENPLPFLKVREIFPVLGLAILPTVVGHSIYNYSMKHMKSQIVSLMGQGESLWATLLAFLFFSEIPAKSFYLAAILVITGIVVIVSPWRRAKTGVSRRL